MSEDSAQKKLGKVVKVAERLSREHKEMKKTLEKVQETTGFYQSRFTQAHQVMTAVQKGHVPTPKFKPDFLGDKKYLETVRNLCKEAVFSIFNEEHRPTRKRSEIVPIVQEKVKRLIELGEWPRSWTPPGRDTIIRRLNETADIRHWQEGITPLIAIKPGRYAPNPLLFDKETREKLEEMARKWRD